MQMRKPPVCMREDPRGREVRVAALGVQRIGEEPCGGEEAVLKLVVSDGVMCEGRGSPDTVDIPCLY